MFVENMSEKLMIPKEVSLGASVLHITGQYELWIENYKSVLEYTNDRIRLQAKPCKIIVTGKNLEIAYFNETGMKVKGRIKSIEFI